MVSFLSIVQAIEIGVILLTNTQFQRTSYTFYRRLLKCNYALQTHSQISSYNSANKSIVIDSLLDRREWSWRHFLLPAQCSLPEITYNRVSALCVAMNDVNILRLVQSYSGDQRSVCEISLISVIATLINGADLRHAVGHLPPIYRSISILVNPPCHHRNEKSRLMVHRVAV